MATQDNDPVKVTIDRQQGAWEQMAGRRGETPMRPTGMALAVFGARARQPLNLILPLLHSVL